MMAAIGRFFEAVIVAGFLGMLVTRELLRAHATERSGQLMRRLGLPALGFGVAFALVIGGRFYDLAQ